jgi:hypothetical protein
MGFLTSGFFWAVVLILLGVIILVKNLFNLNIPVFRIFFGVLIIIIGIMIITNHNFSTRKSNWAFYTNDQNGYNIIFGKMEVNLSDFQLPETNKKIEINTIFGSSIVKISPEIPMVIEVNSAFAGAKLPDGNVITFGKYIYKSKNIDESKPYYLIEANVVFGAMIIENK